MTPPAYLVFRDADGTTEVNEALMLLARAKVGAIDEDGDKETASMFSSAGTPPSLGGGWSGNVLERDLSGGSTDHVVVYSDEEMATRESFKVAYGEIGEPAPDGNGTVKPADLGDSTTEMQRDDYAEAYAKFETTVRDVDFVGETKPGTGHYNMAPVVADAAASNTAFWSVAMSSGFPAKPEAGTVIRREYFGPGMDPANAAVVDGDDDGDHGTTDEDDYNARGEWFRGTFDGVTGEFECIADMGCSVTHSATIGLASTPIGENPEVANGTWQFIASNPEATVTTARPDGDYLTMGAWIEIPDHPAGLYKFTTFFSGRDPFIETGIDALEGEAEYEGPAFGKYVARDAGASGAVQGAFTATAELTADFGEENAAGTISGKVTDFASHSGHNLGDWQVILGSTPIVSASNGFGTTDGVAVGSVLADDSRANGRRWETGAWEGAFFGNDVEDVTPYPGSVAGSFDARWGRSVPISAPIPPGQMVPVITADVGFVGVAGVFGADYVPPPEPPPEDDN